jgi:hypothetical protein
MRFDTGAGNLKSKAAFPGQTRGVNVTATTLNINPRRRSQVDAAHAIASRGRLGPADSLRT